MTKPELYGYFSHVQNIFVSVRVVCMLMFCACVHKFLHIYWQARTCALAFMHENVYISYTVNMIVGLRSDSSLFRTMT